MNKVLFVSFLATLLVVVAVAEDRPKLTVEASQTRGGGERHETFKISQDVWKSKDGRFSAGGYVQHDRSKYSGGSRTRDTQAGFQFQGTF